MKDHIVKLEKTVSACDTRTTEKLLTENARLKNLSEELMIKVAGLEKEQKKSENIIKAITETEKEEHVEHVEATNVDENTSEGIEVSDLIELRNMKESGHERVGPQSQPIPKFKPTNQEVFKCDLCKLVRDTKEKLERHMKNHNEDGDWTCDGCSYQTHEQSDLLNHLLEKRDHAAPLLEHLLNKNVYDRSLKCKRCGELFETKNELHKHLSTKHKSYKPCNKMPTCTGEDCHFNHNEVSDGVHICYECGNESKSKTDLMIHMTGNHVMPQCKHYQKGNCTFGGRCYYSHDNKNVNTVKAKTQTASNFWGSRKDKAPPQQNVSNQHQAMNMMMEMTQNMMLMMKNMVENMNKSNH